MMSFVKIGDAEIDPEQISGFIRSADACSGRCKILIFLKTGQTVTTSVANPPRDLKDLLNAAQANA